MIEFNLLPDVKLQYIKVNQIKRLVIFGSLIAAAASLTIMVALLVFVDGFQKKSISDISSDIVKTKTQIQAIPDLDKVLTVRNQLQALPQLDKLKPVTSRIFPFLQQLTPSSVTLSKVDTDFGLNTISLSGDADSLKTINQFVDTMKFTTYRKSASDTGKTSAFSQVVLSTFSLTGKAATYEIHAAFDPAIFDSANDVTLAVPSITSSRSVTDQPSDLFKQSAAPTVINKAQ